MAIIHSREMASVMKELAETRRMRRKAKKTFKKRKPGNKRKL